MEMGKVISWLDAGVGAGQISADDASEAKELLDPGTDLITRKEVAKMLGKHLFTIDRYAREKRIEKINTPFGPRFKKSQLVKMILTNCGAGA